MYFYSQQQYKPILFGLDLLSYHYCQWRLKYSFLLYLDAICLCPVFDSLYGSTVFINQIKSKYIFMIGFFVLMAYQHFWVI